MERAAYEGHLGRGDARMMDFWDDPYPSISSRHTGKGAERFEAGRPIALGFFEVCRLAERRRRLDAGEPILHLVSSATFSALSTGAP